MQCPKCTSVTLRNGTDAGSTYDFVCQSCGERFDVINESSGAQPSPLDYEGEQAFGEDYATWLAAHDQKVRAETLEEAAKVADQYPTYRRDDQSKGSAAADAIRSLAAPAPAPAASKPETGQRRD